jgi:hypothetical protein
VVEEGGQDGPVALAFEGAGRRRLQQRPGLAVAQRRRLAFIVVDFWALDATNRVVADRVNFAQVVKERGDRGEFAPDGVLGQAAALQVFAPSDQVGAGGLAHFFGPFDAGESRKLLDIEPVGAPGARVVEVGEPLQFGRHVPISLNLSRFLAGLSRLERPFPAFKERK